ncbi:hypothetical protein Drorol1_Dr00018844 [Drosera rotundifolia]
MASGVFLSLGNLTTHAFPLVCIVSGTTLDYFLEDRINKAEILFPGITCFLIAVLLVAAVHVSNSADNKVKLEGATVDQEKGNDVSTKREAEFGTAGFLIELEDQRAIKSSFKAYLNDWNGRGLALLTGVLCGFGNDLQFMGGQAAGYAAADSVKALPLVSTFWGILLFGEYRKSSRITYFLLGAVAVALLMASSGHRKDS